MAKNILIKSKEGVRISFALKEIVLKGETITQFPSGAQWSDGLTKPYVYGESYVNNLPDNLVSTIGNLLIPAEIETVEEEAEGEVQ